MSKAYAATHGFVADGGGWVGLGWPAVLRLRRRFRESPKVEVWVLFRGVQLPSSAIHGFVADGGG